MSKNFFANLKNKENLSHAYLYRGKYQDISSEFADSLKKINIHLNKPGHFIINGGTFAVAEARELVSWHNNGANGDDDYTVAVIAPDVFRKEAQQMLLKILEETRENFLIFLFLNSGIDVIDTILSRVQVYYLDNTENLKIIKFLKQNTGDKIKTIQAETKGMESGEIREYTQNLVNESIIELSKDVNKNKNILDKLIIVQNSLTNSYIAPKFILDYVVTIL